MYFGGKKYTSDRGVQSLELSTLLENSVVTNSLKSLLNGGGIYSSAVNDNLGNSYKDAQGWHKANVVFADVIFRVSDSDSVMKDYKFSIKVPSKWIFSLEEGIYKGEEEFNFNEGVEENYELDNSSLSRFHKLNDGIDKVNFNIHTEDNYKRQFDNHFKHSENALIIYLLSTAVISTLVEDLLSKIDVGTTTLNEVIFNLHSTREICQYCDEGVKSLLALDGKFLNRLKSVLIENQGFDKKIIFTPELAISLNCTYFLNKNKEVAQEYFLKWFCMEGDFYHTHTSFVSGSKNKAGFVHYNNNLWWLISTEFDHNKLLIDTYLAQMSAEHGIFKGRLISNIQKYNQNNEAGFTIEQLDAFTLNIMLLLEGHVDLLNEEMLDIAGIGVRPINVLVLGAGKHKMVVNIDIEDLEGGDLPENLQNLFYEILPLARAHENSYTWGVFETSLAEYIGYLLDITEPDEVCEQIYIGIGSEEARHNQFTNNATHKYNPAYIDKIVQAYAPHQINSEELVGLIKHNTDSRYLSKKAFLFEKFTEVVKSLSQRLSINTDKYPNVQQLLYLAITLQDEDEGVAIYKFETAYSKASKGEQDLYDVCSDIEYALEALGSVNFYVDSPH